MNEDLLTMSLDTYEQAAALLAKVGILPLAPLAPRHPSLVGLTASEQWHTDLETDPWTWRVRFPATGAAAYGKFIKGKAVLIDRDWFPLVLRAAADARSVDQRYRDGMLSKAAQLVYHAVKEHEGIDTRKLRVACGMQAKEDKKAFDKAVAELQSTWDIVISGIKKKTNSAGEVNGWSAAAYETTAHWMESHGLEADTGARSAAAGELLERLEQVCTPEAAAYFQKIWSL